MALQEERDLVCAIRAGSQSAFTAIVDCYQARIARYLRRLVGDRLLAEDLTQETFLSAYTAIAKNSADLALSPWLYRIATNHAKMHFRRKRLIRFLPFLESRHGGAAPPADEHLGEQDQVRRAMARLTPQYAICPVLHVVEGFKHYEVGAIVGISAEAARKRVARGCEMFRAAYETEEVTKR
jgi:RNA polymerase sigma factor (sigma-70 family)